MTSLETTPTNTTDIYQWNRYELTKLIIETKPELKKLASSVGGEENLAQVIYDPDMDHDESLIMWMIGTVIDGHNPATLITQTIGSSLTDSIRDSLKTLPLTLRQDAKDLIHTTQEEIASYSEEEIQAKLAKLQSQTQPALNQIKENVTDSHHQKTSDLSSTIEKRNNTTLGDELWSFIDDFYSSKHDKREKEWYCGRWVKNILTAFGIEWLPWANGKDRDESQLLESDRGFSHNGKVIKFVKVPIDTPYDAIQWAVVVYDEDATSGSATDARKKRWHVEIKWADDQFYSYYKSERAGGSAKLDHDANTDQQLAQQDPQTYQQQTWFTGYAYYPVYAEDYDDAVALVHNDKDALIA